MEIWRDRNYPNIIRAHFASDATDNDKNALIDNLIMQTVLEQRDVNLIITKDFDHLTSDSLDMLVNSVRLCLIQNNVKKFTIIHPEQITLPFTCDKEVVSKWQFYSTLDDAYAHLGVLNI